MMREEDMLDLKEGLRVRVKKEAGLLSISPILGRVRGVRDVFNANGRLVIVETDEMYTDYSCLAVWEMNLEVVEEEEKK